jgi:hypothetical protein
MARWRGSASRNEKAASAGAANESNELKLY